jgi:hypothetical protein
MVHNPFRSLSALIISILTALTVVSPSLAAGPATQPTVSLFAMGDWGDGGAGQKAIAQELGKIAASQKVPINAMLSAGDNFYVPVTSVNDPAWKTVFEDMYNPRQMPMPFYACLGNHDYPAAKAEIEMAYSQVHPDSRWKMPGYNYRADFPADHPLVSLFVLDSNKDNVPAERWQAQTKWLEAELAKPHPGVWTIAMAHHPMFSNGSHGDIGPLMTEWGPLFQKYGLDFYLCGHDHDIQHLQIPDWHTTFLLVGGGGKKTGAMRRDNRGPFSRSMLGFADMIFTQDQADVRFIDRDGNVVHHFDKSRDGSVVVQSTTGMDKKTNNPLKALQGIGQED